MADVSTTFNEGTLTANTSAAALNGGSSWECVEVIVQNDPDSAADVFVGSSAAQHIQLKPDRSMTIPAADVNKIYVKTASGTATVNWMARR